MERMMTLKTVMRADPVQRKFRLFRVIRNVGNVGDGVGFSHKIAVALSPKLFGFWRELEGWRVAILGVEIHSRKSFGGRFI